MGSYRDNFLSFQPDDATQVFNGITTGADYVVGRDQGLFIAPSLPRARRESVCTAYPHKLPMEATKGWRRLVSGYLQHEMSHDFELRRRNWQEAQRIYFSTLRGDVRIVADLAAEPPDSFLRRELIPLLALRRDEVTSINRMPVADFLRMAAPQTGLALKPAKIIILPRKLSLPGA